MTTQEIQVAWQASFDKHYARLLADASNRNPSPAIQEHVAELAKKAADADVRLLTRPPRWI